MSGQVIHVHNYADGPPAVKSAPVQLTDAERKAGLRSLVAGSAVVKGLAKPLRGGMRIAAKSDSAESDAMTAMATQSKVTNSPAGEVQAALRGNSSDYSVPSVSASDIAAVGTGVSPAYLAKCERVLADPKASAEDRAAAGETVTHARLLGGVLGVQPVAKSTAAEMPKLIGRLEDILKSGQPLKDSTKDEIGQVITHYRLTQGAIAGQAAKTVVSQLTSTAQDERDASNAEVRRAQQRPAISGTPSVSADDQIRSIVGDGQPMSLGEAQSFANGGYITSGGRTEPDPAVVEQLLEDELSKGTLSPLQRQSAGESLTYLRLVRGVNAAA